MRKIFLLPVLLLCAFALVTWSCGEETTEESCDSFPDEVSTTCAIPSDANICCDETSCTLTMGQEEYTCDDPEMVNCIEGWVTEICGDTKSVEDRAAVAATLRAMTTKLLKQARANSVCR